METHDFFLYLLVILLTARVFAELAARWQAPSVIGELFAGVLLGPSLLGWIEPVEAIKLMAEIGMAIIPRGEVGLIFAELGRVSGIFSNEIYAGMVIVIALTTLLSPFIMKWFCGCYGDRLQTARQ